MACPECGKAATLRRVARLIHRPVDRARLGAYAGPCMPQVNTPPGGAPRRDHGKGPKRDPAPDFRTPLDHEIFEVFCNLDRMKGELRLAEMDSDMQAIPDLREMVATLQARYEALVAEEKRQAADPTRRHT
jgi:hypothetical protein